MALLVRVEEEEEAAAFFCLFVPVVRFGKSISTSPPFRLFNVV